MKKTLLISFMLLLGIHFSSAQVCNPAGNVIIYSNYDGGEININVDQNIPNLKIGIVAYEAARINITGAFVGNVTQVIFAGYPSTNSTHCSTTIPATSVNGVSAGIVSILSYPAATLSNPNGYNSIICAYSCDNTTSQGGCNTVDQIEHYFITQFSGTLFSHHTQYGCWLSTDTYLVSAGGNCCPTSGLAPVADFSVTDNNFSICVGDCIDLTDLSTNIPTTWSWSMPGASTTSSTIQNPSNICYPTAGSFSISLTAGNTNGSDNISYNIVVNPLPSVPTITPVGTSLQSSVATSYQWSLNGTEIVGATNQSYPITVNGNYTVTITDANGCSNTSAVYNYTSVGINESLESEMILVFPNPANDLITIRVPNSLTVSQILILDIAGKIVKSENLNATLSNLNISDLANGSYSIIVNSESKMITKKLFIQR